MWLFRPYKECGTDKETGSESMKQEYESFMQITPCKKGATEEGVAALGLGYKNIL